MMPTSLSHWLSSLIINTDDLHSEHGKQKPLTESRSSQDQLLRLDAPGVLVPRGALQRWLRHGQGRPLRAPHREDIQGHVTDVAIRVPKTTRKYNVTQPSTS